MTNVNNNSNPSIPPPNNGAAWMMIPPSITPRREIRNLIAGGIAGMLAKSFVAPIDRIKIMYQITATQFHLRDIPRVASGIIHTEGFTALWKGNVATLIRVFPYSGIQFMVYDQCKHYFLMKRKQKEEEEQERRSSNSNRSSRIYNSNFTTTTTTTKQHLTPGESLLAGSCAGAISVLCTYPLDLTRAQLAVLKNKRDDHGVLRSSHRFIDVLLENYKTRGFLGLFRGITPTILGILPYAGVAFSINEQGKKSISTFTGRDPTNIERMFCGGVSGLVAQSITYPFEVTRRRMQTLGIVPTSGSDAAVDVLNTLSSSAGQGSSKVRVISDASSLVTTTTIQQNPPSMLKTMRHVMNEQGIHGFFKGVSMNWFKGPVAFSISFTTYDLIQGLFDSHADASNTSSKSISFS